jgi:hypothetical protein
MTTSDYTFPVSHFPTPQIFFQGASSRDVQGEILARYGFKFKGGTKTAAQFLQATLACARFDKTRGPQWTERFVYELYGGLFEGCSDLVARCASQLLPDCNSPMKSILS